MTTSPSLISSIGSIRSSKSMLSAFEDEVAHTQQTFRKLLTAMSKPATLMTLEQPVANDRNISKLDNAEYNDDIKRQESIQTKLMAIWAVAQTVLDSEVSVFVDSKMPEILSRSIRFFTGALLVDCPTQADFIFIDIAELASLLEHNKLNVGTLEKPHTNTVIIVQEDALSNCNTTHENKEIMQVSGPGIESVHQLLISGIEENIVTHLTSNQRLFPCGIDWIFCAGNQLTALPRTSQVTLSELNIELDI